jgi:hypothetical protein
MCVRRETGVRITATATQATKAPVTALKPNWVSAAHRKACPNIPTATGHGSMCSGVEKKTLYAAGCNQYCRSKQSCSDHAGSFHDALLVGFTAVGKFACRLALARRRLLISSSASARSLPRSKVMTARTVKRKLVARVVVAHLRDPTQCLDDAAIEIAGELSVIGGMVDLIGVFYPR